MKPFQKEKSGYMNSIEAHCTLREMLWHSQIWDTSLQHLMKNSLVGSGQSPPNSLFFFSPLSNQQDLISTHSCKLYIIVLWDMLYYNVPAKGHLKTMAAYLGISIETHNPSRWPGSHTHCQAQRHHAKQCICQVRNMTHFLAPLWLQPIFKEHTLSFSEPFCLAYQTVTFDLIESWFGIHGNS